MRVESALRPCVGRNCRWLASPRLLKVFLGLINSDVGRVLYFYRHASCRCSSGLEAGARGGGADDSAVWRVAIQLPGSGVEGMSTG